MRYYIPQDYTEHYVVPFSDVDGNEWKVSIQEPNYHGTPVTLVGAAEPIEWMGRGDEDQTEVILGSTGTLRLVRTGDTDIYFQKNSLLPTYINDRRVQVFMMRNGEWALFWQGFILPESFSQDWDATPSEVELPIVSVVAALEYFPLPLKQATESANRCYTYFSGQTNIAGLLRAIFIWSGCEILNIVTNKQIYEDFNGQTQSSSSGGAVHWTQGKVSSEYFYERENGVIRPKTFKDMLETLTYPYGKVQDYAYDVCILMRWMDDANEESKLYAIPVWGDYDEQEQTNVFTFSEYTDIPYINLTDIETESTDNTQSEILAPREVNFSVEPEADSEIFSFNEKYINPTLYLPTTEPDGMENAMMDSGKRRFLYAISQNDVNTDFAEDWGIIVSPDKAAAKERHFCRVVDITANNDTKKTTSDLIVPLGLCFNVPEKDNQVYISFTVPQGVRSRVFSTLIKLSLKFYLLEKENPGADVEDKVDVLLYIQDLSENKWLMRHESGEQEGQWSWTPIKTAILLSRLTDDNGTRELYFNEYRDGGDVLPHKLHFEFFVKSNLTLGFDTFGRAFMDMSLEYVEHCFLDNNVVTWGNVMAVMAKNITMKRKMSGNGQGEDLDIELKTMAGNQNVVAKNNIAFPYNSFCDATKYIDTVARKKIEIEAAKSEPLYWGGYDYYLAAQYAVVKDGYKVFIPVAVGMNPRMSTLRLTLVSTNVNAS